MDNQIFLHYQNSKLDPNITITDHVIFDPLKTFNDLNKEKMDNHISHEIYKDITPWRALSQVIAIPVIMLALIVAMKINIILKIILILLIIIHVIISTCLISHLFKTNNEKIYNNNQTRANETNLINNK